MDAGEAWGEDMLPSLDAFLQQRGLVLREDEDEWSEEVLASIDEFLRQRDVQLGRDGAAGAGDVEGPADIGTTQQDEDEDQEWDDELLAGIDEVLRQREAMSQGVGESGAKAAEAAAEAAEPHLATGADAVPGVAARGADETDDASFDDDCIRALEQAEQEYLETRRAREERAFACEERASVGGRICF